MCVVAERLRNQELVDRIRQHLRPGERPRARGLAVEVDGVVTLDSYEKTLGLMRLQCCNLGIELGFTEACQDRPFDHGRCNAFERSRFHHAFQPAWT